MYMIMGKSITQYPFVTEAKQIKELSRPLEEGLGITGFYYMKVYSDGTLVDLATEPNWGVFFFEELMKGHYETSVIQPHFFPSECFTRWSNVSDNLILQQGKSLFNIADGMTLCQFSLVATEIFSFFWQGADINVVLDVPQIQAKLMRFTQYFKRKAYREIYKAEADPIRLNDFIDCLTNEEGDGCFKDDFVGDRILVQRWMALSRREKETIFWLARGKSAEEISLILGCAKKTVESHINHIKNKLDIHKLTALVYQASQLGLL